MNCKEILSIFMDITVCGVIIKAYLVFVGVLPEFTYREISLYAVISLAYVGYLEVHRQVEGKN